MNKNVFIIGILAVLYSFGLVSCSPDYETDFHKDYLEVPYRSRAVVAFNVDGGEYSVKVNTNLPKDKWNAESNSSWCTVRKENDKVIVSAGPNENFKTRLAQLSIYYGHQKYDISVRQLGKASALEIIEEDGFKKNKKGVTTKDIDATLTELTVPLHTNLNIDHVIIPDTANWISQDLNASQEGEGGGEFQFGRKKVVLKIQKNTNLTERYCTVILQSSERWDATTELVIKQGPRGFIVEPIEGETKSEYEVEDLGGYINVPFNRNGNSESFDVTIPEGVNWINRVPKTRVLIKDTIRFYVEPNEVQEPRNATIKIKSKNTTEVSEINVVIKQKAFVPVTPNNVNNLIATPGQGSVTLSWQLPDKVNYSKVIIKYFDIATGVEKTKEVIGKSITSATINRIFSTKGEHTFRVKTAGPTGIESENEIEVKSTGLAIDYRHKYPLTVQMTSANASQKSSANLPGEIGNYTDGGGIPALYDNNEATFYHTTWEGSSSDGKAHRLEFNFGDKPLYRKFTIEYTGRMNANNGDVKKADLYTSTDGQTWVKSASLVYNLPNGSGSRRIVPTTTVTLEANVKYLRFIPTERRNKVLSAATDWFYVSGLDIIELRDNEWGEEFMPQ